MCSIVKQKWLPILLLIGMSSVSCSVTYPMIKSTDEKMDLAIENKSLRQISLSLSSDEKYIMTGGIYTNYALWDISDGKPVTIAKLDDNIVNANYMHVFLTANNKYTVFVYYISGLATAVVRERESGMEVKRVAIPIPLSALAMSLSMPTPLWNASMSSNGRYLLIGAVLQLFIYDLDNSKFIELQSPYTNNPFLLRGINANALSKDGKYALSGGQGKITKLWEVERGKLKKEFDNSSWIYSVAFSDDSTYVASGDGDGNIKLWNTKTGSFEKEFRGHAGKVSAVSFSSDGRYIISGSWDNSIRIWDVISGKEIKTFHNMDRAVNTIRNFLIGDPIKGVTSVSFSKDGKYVYATIGGALKIFSTITDEEVASFIAFEDGEWIVITPEGYYNSSSNAHKFISVNVNPTSNADSRAKAAYTMENFYDVFYRPDIVTAKLKGEDISRLITLTIDDAIKTPPPTVEFTTVPTDTNQAKAKVCYKIESTGGGIGEVRLFQNGKLIQSDGFYKDVAKTAGKIQLASLDSKSIREDMRSIVIKSTADISPIASMAKGDIVKDCLVVDAVPGENEVSVSAFNKDNTVQSYMKTSSFKANIKAEDSNLFMLIVGTDQYNDQSVNLKYAVKDAKDIKDKLLSQSATLYKPENIHAVVLTDKEATKVNIQNQISMLAKKIKPADSFVLFVAGHGVLLQNQYFMLTRDFDGAINDNSMISSNEIVEASKQIKSLSQLFIFDTCHAGGVDYIVSGLYDARMSVLAKKMGLHIYASANDKQAAMDGYKGNGLFTYTLLVGLNNKKEADKNNDGAVSLVELGGFSKQATADISKEIGHSQTPLIINFGKDQPVYKLQNVR